MITWPCKGIFGIDIVCVGCIVQKGQQADESDLAKSETGLNLDLGLYRKRIENDDNDL